jgi:stage II sporulation protein D
VPRKLVGLILLAVGAAAQPTIKVRLKPNVDRTISEMPLERYVAAVIAAESGTFRSAEALKAMAVAARTYALHFRGRHASDGYDLCGTTHCQRLEPNGIDARIQAAVDATAGEILWYRGSPIFAAYSRDCGGVTEDVASVWPDTPMPYLRSHPDPYCTRPATGGWRWSASAEQVAAALRKSGLRAPVSLAGVAVARRTESGRNREVALTGGGETVRVAAGSFRLAVSRALGFNTIRSERWVAVEGAERIEFQGIGEGHGVGMCQRGAERMGVEGKTWREILAFYFPGAPVGKTAQGLEWTRLAGESVALYSTQADRDRVLLPLAERYVREIAGRTGIAVPHGIEVRVYPDLDAFRNATGEAGWVAARTSGRRIEMQPAAVLRSKGALESTLRHELVHAVLESQTANGVPVWFREGLTAYLSDGPSATGAVSMQRTEESQARATYRAAAMKVAGLIQRYGLPAVVSWLRAGGIPE